MSQKLPSAPDGHYGYSRTNYDPNAEPQPGTFIPMRDQFVGSFQKRVVVGEGEGKVLSRHLQGAFEDLHLLFPQANSLAKRDHFILLIEQSPLKADEVIFVAQVCRCDDRLSCCYNIRA